jgi:DNA helicase INO80
MAKILSSERQFSANVLTGEGNFDDNSAKPSGAATPVSIADGPPAKRRKGISKKAKTLKQRLAVADGSADPDTFQ